MNMLGLSLASVGNHEFDKGIGRASAHAGRRLRQVHQPHTLPARAVRRRPLRISRRQCPPRRRQRPCSRRPRSARSARSSIGFIGETLKETGLVVTPAGVAGLHFADEAATANALVPKLKAAGADAIVLLIHQGGKLPESMPSKAATACPATSCRSSTGSTRRSPPSSPAIRTKLTPARSQKGGATRLLTSAGKYGYLYTDVRLEFDPATHKLIGERAANVPVTGQAGADPKVAALVRRYADAVKPEAERVVGHLAGPLAKSPGDRESPSPTSSPTPSSQRPGGPTMAARSSPSSTPAERARPSSRAPTGASPTQASSRSSRSATTSSSRR